MTPVPPDPAAGPPVPVRAARTPGGPGLSSSPERPGGKTSRPPPVSGPPRAAAGIPSPDTGSARPERQADPGRGRTADLLSLGLGGGWQSSCLLLMSCAGILPKLDAAIFADTQGEMPGTYEYLDYLQGQCDKAGIKLIRATGGNLYQDVFDKAGKGMQPSLPVRVRDEHGELQRLNGYTCSYDYKRRIVTREVRRLCGPRGAWKNAAVEHWIGYSLDEMSRMKPDLECRCGHQRPRTASKRTGRDRGHEHGGGRCLECGCTRWAPWRVNRWPLITELHMSRTDCREWITSNGYPPPERSACWHCPNRGNSHWRDLRDNHPGLWAQARALDEFGRHGYNKLRGEAFLHQSGVPLAQADLRSRVQQLEEDRGVMPLFADEDMDCDAGVCFT